MYLPPARYGLKGLKGPKHTPYAPNAPYVYLMIFMYPYTHTLMVGDTDSIGLWGFSGDFMGFRQCRTL